MGISDYKQTRLHVYVFMFKLNAEKMEIQLKEITFMGHHMTENDLHSDPEKVRAIMDMPPPTNLEELRRYLGVVNYLGEFLPNATNTL